jgi:outer membrane protein assembly factor BamB
MDGTRWRWFIFTSRIGQPDLRDVTPGQSRNRRAISLDTGTEQWKDDYPTAYVSRPEAARVGMGPRSTPVVRRDRVFTFGATGVLSSYDAGTGKLRWRKHTSTEFDDAGLRYGVSMSPLIERDLLIAHIGHEQEGALAAYDSETGKAKWRIAGCSPSYSSPVVAEFANVRQVVVVCYRSVAGVALDAGRVLWEQRYEPLKYPHSLTPLVYGDTIVMSGYSKGLTSFRVSGDAPGWRVQQEWHNDAVSMSLSSPVIHGDYLYGLIDRNRGQFVCVDVQTGAVMWTSQGREGEMASVVGMGDQIIFMKDQGELVIANADPRGLNITARYALADGLTWPMPAIAAGQLIVRHGEELSRWEVPGR